eukprot:COSAG02_NODE_404_length_23022_cov_305.366008_3_plen_63_part_00
MLVAAPAVTEIGLEVRVEGQVGSWRYVGRSVEGARSAGWATWMRPSAPSIANAEDGPPPAFA